MKLYEQRIIPPIFAIPNCARCEHWFPPPSGRQGASSLAAGRISPLTRAAPGWTGRTLGRPPSAPGIRRRGPGCVSEPVSGVMRANPSRVTPDASAADLLEIMEEKLITVLPVVDENGFMKGLIHLHDILGRGELRFSGKSARRLETDYV